LLSIVARKALPAALSRLLSGLHNLAVAVRILADLAVVVVTAVAMLAALIVVVLRSVRFLWLLTWHGTLLARPLTGLWVRLLLVRRRLGISVFVGHTQAP
jgi:hypothetical protein